MQFTSWANAEIKNCDNKMGFCFRLNPDYSAGIIAPLINVNPISANDP